MATSNEGIKVYLQPELVERLRARAKSDGRTQTGMIRIAVARYLDWLDEQERAAA